MAKQSCLNSRSVFNVPLLQHIWLSLTALQREESQRRFEVLLNEIAPPPNSEVPSTEAQDDSNGGLAKDRDDEDNDEDPGNRQ